MTWKTLAAGKQRVSLGAGPNSQVFGTLYTVPAGKTATIKEVLFVYFSLTGIVSNACLYVLSSGNTDLTAVAADVRLLSRSATENKPVQPLSADVASLNEVAPGTTTPTILARNTIMAAGDKLNAWVDYGAVTPVNQDLAFQVSGDET